MRANKSPKMGKQSQSHQTSLTKTTSHRSKLPKKLQSKKIQKKAVLKQQKRNKWIGWAGRLDPKVNIPVKTDGPDDFLRIQPEVGQYFEDPQGHEPFMEEGRGAFNWSHLQKNEYRLMAGVRGTPYPEKIGFTKQDTLYTYGRRVHRLEMKTFINAMREMEEMRIERNYQIASRQAQEITDRSKIYQDWRTRKKNNKMYDHTVRTQKHAAALAAGYARGQENERKRKLEHAKLQKQYIELMMSERRTTWIEDPENINPEIFTTIEHPTGWWPNDDTRQLTYNKFDTDDYDIEKYFTTSFPAYTDIRPRREGTSEFYDVIQNGEPGWRRENKALGTKIHRYLDLGKPKISQSTRPAPEIDLPSEAEEEPLLANVQEARAGIRTRTFLLHEAMPAELNGILRNVGSASNVEKPNYKPTHTAFEHDGPANPFGIVDTPDDDNDVLHNPNKPHHHRISL